MSKSILQHGVLTLEKLQAAKEALRVAGDPVDIAELARAELASFLPEYKFTDKYAKEFNANFKAYFDKHMGL